MRAGRLAASRSPGATLATDGSTWSSTTSTPTTRARRLPAPAYSANPTTTATATADTAPATSKETSGASAPAQFHSTGTGWPPRGRREPDRPDLHATAEKGPKEHCSPRTAAMRAHLGELRSRSVVSPCSDVPTADTAGRGAAQAR